MSKHKSQLHHFNDCVSCWRNIRAFASKPEFTTEAKSEEDKRAEEKHKDRRNDTPQNFFRRGRRREPHKGALGGARGGLFLQMKIRNIRDSETGDFCTPTFAENAISKKFAIWKTYAFCYWFCTLEIFCSQQFLHFSAFWVSFFVNFAQNQISAFFTFCKNIGFCYWFCIFKFFCWQQFLHFSTFWVWFFCKFCWKSNFMFFCILQKHWVLLLIFDFFKKFLNYNFLFFLIFVHDFSQSFFWTCVSKTFSFLLQGWMNVSNHEVFAMTACTYKNC